MPTREDESLTLEDLREALAGDAVKAGAFLAEVHGADLASLLLDASEEETAQVYSLLDQEAQVELVEYADEALRTRLVQDLRVGELVHIATELPADEVVDLLELIDDKRTSEVLDRVETERAQELRALSVYPPDSAGGVMTSDFVTIESDMRIGDAVKCLKQDSDTDVSDDDIGIFVVDADGRPVGYLSLHGILTHSIHDSVVESMVEAFTIDALADQEEAAKQIHKYGLQALAVVDDAGLLVGVISSEDASEVLEEEVAEDLMKIVGASVSEQTRMPVMTRVRHRLPLQSVTVLGGLVTAFILDRFMSAGGTIEPTPQTELLRFLPIVIGLAGNVGIQSSTILVRAFATGEVEPAREPAVLSSEVRVGAVIGILCGLATAIAASLMEDGVLMTRFGLAIGAAIVVAVAWASTLGCLVPMSCRRLGIDPAIVAGPFLISLSDISGSAIFVGVAMALLL